MIRILAVAGEVSGDRHTAKLLRALKNNPGVEVIAVGGANMKEACGGLEEDIVSRAVMGFSEVLGEIPYFIKLKKINIIIKQTLFNAIITKRC